MSMGRFDELLRHIQPLRPEKATAGNYILSGPITAIAVRINATHSYFLEVRVKLWRRGP